MVFSYSGLSTHRLSHEVHGWYLNPRPDQFSLYKQNDKIQGRGVQQKSFGMFSSAPNMQEYESACSLLQVVK